MTSPALPIPADFHERGAGKTSDVAAHYGVAESTIRKWRRETGVKGAYKQARHTGPRPNQRIPVPEGFAAFLEAHSMRQASEHFGLSRKAIERMMDDSGIPRKRGIYQQRAPKPSTGGMFAHRTASGGRAFAGYRKAPVIQKRAHMAANHVTRDDSLEGRAADHLRRFGPVWRCADERGRFDPKGELWRVGNRVLTAAELIERAEGKGFERDGWRQLGAAISEHERDRRMAA